MDSFRIWVVVPPNIICRRRLCVYPPLIKRSAFDSLALSKIILPKISDNLEIRKSQVLDNLELAEKQRNDSEAKLKEFDNIILKSKIEAKNLFN